MILTICRRLLRLCSSLCSCSPNDAVALDDALQAPALFDRHKAQVIELRFFGGLSVEETAETLQVSADTVMRDWRPTKVWPPKELRGNR